MEIVVSEAEGIEMNDNSSVMDDLSVGGGSSGRDTSQGGKGEEEAAAEWKKS